MSLLPPPQSRASSLKVGSFLVATHLSSLAAAPPTNIVIRTSRQQLPLPDQDHNDIPPEHAIFASVIDSGATGTILLRLIHGGVIVELVSLSTDVPPLRLVFPSALLNSPAIFFEDQELHVLAITEFGSLYRIVIPVQGRDLWKHDVENVWPKEHTIRNFPSDSRGCFVQAQGLHCIAIGMPDGYLLRMDADSMGYNSHEEEWSETLSHHGNFLSTFTALLPSLHSSHPNSADIVSLATHPWPSDIPHIWTLSRDRTLRLWKAKLGCVSSKTLPFYVSSSLDSSRASSSTGAGSTRTHPLLEAERQNLLKIFTASTGVGERLHVLAFIPSTTSISNGGFFCLMDASNDQLRLVSRIETSKRTVHCHLQDFMVVGNNLVTLWENQGRSMVETTRLDIETWDMEDTQEVKSEWSTASYAQEPELTPSYMEERLLSPGSLAEKFLEAIFQPGVFSSLSLQAAITQYTDACSTLPGPIPPQLQATYSTLAENVAAVVGCTVILNRDPQSGALQYANYRTALKRDWEGFVARCREVERSSRWPLALESRGPDDVIIIERERAGSLLIEDSAISLCRHDESDQIVGEKFKLLAVSGALRKKLGPELVSNLEGRLLEMMHQEFAFSVVDILQDQASKLQIREALEEGLASWFAGRLQTITDLTEDAREPFNAIGGFEYMVKQEDEHPDLSVGIPQGHSPWFRGLTARFIAVAIEARYNLALSLMTLLLYLAQDLTQRDEALVAEAFAVFKGTAMLRYIAAQPAERPAKEGSAQASDEDVISRLRNMDVSHNRAPSAIPTSLIYLLLAQSDIGDNIPAIAHNFLDNSGLLRSCSPVYATTYEVVFCERLRTLKFYGVARELLSCLPRTAASSIVLAQVWLQIGRIDDAAQLFEKLAGSFGPNSGLAPEDIQPLKKVLPSARSIQSEFAYYIYVSELFKAHKLVRYEVQFAQLAISVAPLAADTSSLWSIVTKGYAELGLYEEAYAALITMPYEKLKREFTSHLALQMCEANAVARLMAFDFAGISEEVESILSFKARNADPRLQPNYSRILYTWYIQRGEYRNAALVMYQRALKFQEIINNAHLFISHAPDQLDSYSIAINALTLVDEPSQWIILPVIPDPARKRKGSSKYIPESKFLSSKYDSQIVHLADMQRQHTLLAAQISIIERNPGILTASEFLLPPAVLVMRLTHHDLFAQALTVGSTLKVDMIDLFTSLTSHCIRFSKNPGSPIPFESDWLLTDNSTTWSGSTADRAWRFLRQSLERYDGPDTDYRYAKAVLETILTTDRSSPPPPWLVQIVESQQPEYLIRLSLRYENIDDAVSYLLNMLRKSDRRLAREPSPGNASSTWLPYTLVDQVMVAASAQIKTPPLLAQLRAEIGTRMKRVQKLSHVSA
ncbi:nucleoporin Nup120/160-domain-containing protein [Ephemerocybe angulata]|uniref:Nucleoporin Nup120/160-domain-containing protein n=1 Tax=Ephemerocybe angulata TaxID=980116 RepID=A0A8H6ICE8_9AGAR|nr:nucleoporin Nup120/160-domain-containing protein [Tulosesus angulatus]